MATYEGQRATWLRNAKGTVQGDRGLLSANMLSRSFSPTAVSKSLDRLLSEWLIS